jgi:hypothetical protein
MTTGQKCGSNLRLRQCFDVINYTVTYATLSQKTYTQISRTSASHYLGRQGHRLFFYTTHPTICGDILPPSCHLYVFLSRRIATTWPSAKTLNAERNLRHQRRDHLTRNSVTHMLLSSRRSSRSSKLQAKTCKHNS